MKIIASIIAACIAFAPAGALAAPQAGDQAPGYLGVTLDGKELQAKEFAGKVLVVSFWATWCGPCRKELPMLEGLQRTVGDRIQVVAVNIEDRDVFRRAARSMEDYKLTFSHDYRRPSEAYGVKGIPHMVIIGRDGKIVKVNRGYSEEALPGVVADINAALADKL